MNLRLSVVALTATLVLAQTRPAFDEFEVATVKPAAADQPGRYFRMESAHRFVAKNYTVKLLIGLAYDVNPRQISGGPAWIDSERYEIVAATPGEVRPNFDEQMTMLRKLLAERFNLAVHREPKVFPIYVLTVAKDGPKLRETAGTPDDQPFLIGTIFPAADGNIDRVQLPARNATIAQFASMLQRAVMDRPVVDKTGLSGKYDFDLEWTPDDTQYGGQLPAVTAESHKPDLFAALQQQVGLRLEAARGPIDIVAIDRVEKPGDN